MSSFRLFRTVGLTLFATTIAHSAIAEQNPPPRQQPQQPPPTAYTIGRAVGRLEAAILETDASFSALKSSRDQHDRERLKLWGERKENMKLLLSEVEQSIAQNNLRAAQEKVDSVVKDLKVWQVNAPVAVVKTASQSPLLYLPGFVDYDLYGPYGWGAPLVMVNPAEVLKLLPDAAKDLKSALMEHRRQTLGDKDPVYQRWLQEQKNQKK